jgi:hypothetical protein
MPNDRDLPEDREPLEWQKAETPLAHRRVWLAESEQLAADILARRQGRPLDVDALWHAARVDLNEHVASTIGP